MSTPSETYIKTLKGYRAFHPNPLPSELDLSLPSVRALSEAEHLLGRLAGEGAKLPNPHVLIRPFVRREAVYSSRIEGTQATLGELLAAEAGAHVNRSPDDLREVANYVTALEYGLEQLPSLPLSLRLIRELHGKLMLGVRGDYATPGEFRRTQNWIGPPGCTLMNAAYVPPPPDALMSHLGQWEDFLHDRTLPPLIHAALLHSQFEAIHPFLDGNGRVGRLLIMLVLCERGVLPSPLLYLSAFFEATRRDYYDCLRNITERSDWEGWLQYFLTGVARQAEDALERSKQTNQALEAWRAALSEEGSDVPLCLLAQLASNPFVSVNTAKAALDVSYNTASRAIQTLQRHGILSQSGDAQRNRVFCAQRLLDLLDAPPHMTPESH